MPPISSQAENVSFLYSCFSILLDGGTWETLSGSERHVVVDLFGDSEPDIIGIDFDDDKVTNIALRLLDTDGDTTVDTIGGDSDQDGRFDFLQSIM